MATPCLCAAAALRLRPRGAPQSTPSPCTRSHSPPLLLPSPHQPPPPPCCRPQQAHPSPWPPPPPPPRLQRVIPPFPPPRRQVQVPSRLDTSRSTPAGTWTTWRSSCSIPTATTGRRRSSPGQPPPLDVHCCCQERPRLCPWSYLRRRRSMAPAATTAV
uniref:Uncharacterized protein n=1 Tax=Triticum urartu TaxID=4572 RepID=A0A8R7PAP7_TRIUA